MVSSVAPDCWILQVLTFVSGKRINPLAPGAKLVKKLETVSDDSYVKTTSNPIIALVFCLLFTGGEVMLQLQRLLLKICVFESWVFLLFGVFECLAVICWWQDHSKTITITAIHEHDSLKRVVTIDFRRGEQNMPQTFKPDDVPMICWHDIFKMYLLVGIDLILYRDFILVCKMFNLALACHPAINLAFRKDSLGLWVCHSPKVLGFSDCLRRAPVLHRCLQENTFWPRLRSSNTEIAMQTIYTEAYTVIHWFRDLYYSLH